MAAISRAGINLVGSDAGVAIGEDGPSRMGLEYLALFRSVHGGTVLYPCDANQTAQLVAGMAQGDAHTRSIHCLRTSRGETPVVYGPDDEFPVGGSKLLRSGDEDRLTLLAAGITVHEPLRAADLLAREGIAVRVIDLYSVKLVDEHAVDRRRTDCRRTDRLPGDR